jgi:hypothetical protein
MDRIEPVSRSDRAVTPVGLERLTPAERDEERRRRERERRRKAAPKPPRTSDGRLDIRA